jgi:voltage-gated potassium channel
MASGATEGSLSTVIRRRTLLPAIIRPLVVLSLTLVIYALVPVDGRDAARVVIVLAGLGILMILAVFGWQVSRVARSTRPLVAAVEALALVFGMFVCLFGLLYVALSEGDPDAFSQDIAKVTGIYFTVTVLTTVGFGDIVPTTQTTQAVVTVQMLLGMILIGTAFKILGRSARTAVKARNPELVAHLGSPAGRPAGPTSPQPPDAVPGSSADDRAGR